MCPVPQRELLSQAIADIQGSIHANDSKSSAGLVVQGLLATAAVTLLAHFGGVYGEATATSHCLIKIALIGTLALAGLSIFCLIMAVVPHKPKRRFSNPKSVYFPDVEALLTHHRGSELERLQALFATLNSEHKVEQEYLAELLKVADIRYKEAKWAKRGFVLLAAEVVFVLLFLGTVGAVAGNMLGAARASTGPAIRWEIIEGHRRESFRAVDNATLSHSKAHIRAQASDSAGEQYFKLSRRTSYRCPLVHRRFSGKPVFHNARLFGERRVALVEAFGLDRLRCPGGKRAISAIWRFRAEMRSEGGEIVSGLLRISAHRRGRAG